MFLLYGTFTYYLEKKVPTGKSTNMVLFPKEKVPYSTWYFFLTGTFSYKPAVPVLLV